MVNSRNEIVQLRILGSGKGAEIGAAVALELEGQTYVPIHDHAGNISVLIDLFSQKTAESYTYSAFGETKREGTLVPNPWFFSSKRFDPESGRIYFGRRYYDPNTGRWTTPDPLGFADGPNLYAYVHNNPLTHFDLYGLATIPGPASGSSGPASGVSSGIASGSSRSTSGHYRDSNSGSGSSKWDGGRREEHRCGASAGAHVSIHSGCNRTPGVHASTYPACNSIPGSGLDGATGYHVSDCFIGCPLDEVVHMASCWGIDTLDCLGVAMSVDPSCPSGLLQSYVYAGARLAPWFVGVGTVFKGGAWLMGRFGVSLGSRLTEKLILYGSKGVVAKPNAVINRFHEAAKGLSKTGQNNIRILRGWAKSKGWVKQANPRGGPEQWGVYQNGKFQWHLKIKPEASARSGLHKGSNAPRFDARLDLNGTGYINPFTGEIGGSNIGTHILLESVYLP